MVTAATELSGLVGEHMLDHTPITDVRHPFDSDANGCAFSLDGVLYFVFEDPNDGYRSFAGPLMSAVGGLYDLGHNGGADYIRRRVVGSMSGEVLHLTDIETGQLLFEIGTDNADDYYPSYTCTWHPLKPEGATD